MLIALTRSIPECLVAHRAYAHCCLLQIFGGLIYKMAVLGEHFHLLYVITINKSTIQNITWIVCILLTGHCKSQESMESTKVSCPRTQHNFPGQGLNPDCSKPESSMLTMRPPRPQTHAWLNVSGENSCWGVWELLHRWQLSYHTEVKVAFQLC